MRTIAARATSHPIIQFNDAIPRVSSRLLIAEKIPKRALGQSQTLQILNKLKKIYFVGDNNTYIMKEKHLLSKNYRIVQELNRIYNRKKIAINVIKLSMLLCYLDMY